MTWCGCLLDLLILSYYSSYYDIFACVVPVSANELSTNVIQISPSELYYYWLPIKSSDHRIDLYIFTPLFSTMVISYLV